MAGLRVETAEEGDLDLESFLRGHEQEPFLRRNCVLALVARQERDDGAVVIGFLELTDEPAVVVKAAGGGGSNYGAAAARPPKVEEAAWLKAEPAALGFGPGAAAFVRRCTIAAAAAADGAAPPVALALLRAAFGAAPTLQAVLLASSGEPPSHLLTSSAGDGEAAAGEPCLSALARAPPFAQASVEPRVGLQLRAAPRRAVMPELVVRRARVQDHDEMLPLLQRAAAGRHAALALLPESCRPAEPFALTRLIDSQDGGNAVLVAHPRGCESLVGMLAATCDVDVPLLQSSFDLGPYDGFLQPGDYEALEERARTLAASEAADAAAASGAAAQGGGGREGELDADGAAAGGGPEVEEGVRQILAGLVQEALDGGAGRAPPRHRLFAVTMLCFQDGWEVQAPDLLAAAFDLFADKDYAALTVPHAIPEPPLARLMTVLPPAGGPASAGASVFPDAVLLAHRASLLSEFEVRLAAVEDMAAVQPLLEGLPDAPQLGERIALAMGRGTAVLALLSGEVVGAAAFGEPVELPRLRGAFDLDSLLPPADWPANAQAALEAVVVNPLFEPHSAAFLSRALTLLTRRAAVCGVAPGAAPPPAVAAAAEQVVPRRRQRRAAAAEKPGGPPFPLFAFTRSLAIKRPVHTRIVVVGASDTGLSCLETLLTAPCHRGTLFTHLTLLSPGGLAAAAAAAAAAASTAAVAAAPARFSPEALARLGLEGAVADVDGALAAIDRERRVAVLEDGRELPYDVLALATGLQDPLLARVAAARPEAAACVVPAVALASALTAAATGAGEAAFRTSSTLLIGDSLDALTALSALLDSGADAAAITWVSDHSLGDVGGVARRPGPAALARALARRAGLELPAPQAGRLRDVRVAEGGEGRCSVVVEAPDGAQLGLEVDAIAAAGPLAPDARVALALAAAGLVINSRAVVGAGFATAEPSVLAAGPVAKLSRRYGAPETLLENHNSAEVGARLADAIAAAATGPHAAPAAAAAANTRPPALPAARGASCRLPGGWAFSLAARGEALAAPSLAAPPGGASLLSAAAGGAGGLLSIVTDAAGCIRQACAVARDGSALAGLLPSLPVLVGLPLSYLGLQPPAGAGRAPAEVPADVAAALSEPWAEALLHDGFGALRVAMLSAARAARERGGAVSVAAGAGGGEAGAGLEARLAAAAVTFLEGVPAGELPSLRAGLSEARSVAKARGSAAPVLPPAAQ
ncbi:hypothetical protein Rsub_01511 [Raphidocelis subcapitata]|uniref:Cilia- and flagella-associated protein 61 N-terminal domain-containing protein n=1 Tax=Raphidocelis subcapitata TaxID=307507 RepID=A0A2V0NQW5_9CHLO|nr:hypothetical protein Rsub_01511 [Raphidocelis subcapitata]|eukprot:GBF89012.1 hypothetical protein Rsub_01511 [Raphidocelis subcapitata]